MSMILFTPKSRPVELAHIVRLKADGNYSYVHFSDGRRTELYSKTLSHFEAALPSFIRLDKSNLVNPQHVSRYEPGKFGGFLVVGGLTLTVARRRYAAVDAHLHAFWKEQARNAPKQAGKPHTSTSKTGEV